MLGGSHILAAILALTPPERRGESVELPAGRCVVVEVEQVGIDVRLERPGAAAPDDRRTSGTEVVVLLSERTGRIDLAVSAAFPKLPAGSYGFATRTLPDDPSRLEACRLHLQGQEKGDRESFEKAAAAWDRAGEPMLSAWSTLEVARLALSAREVATGKLAAEEAARRFETLGRRADRLASRLTLGRGYDLEGNWKAARELRRGILADQGDLTPGDRADLRYGLGSAAKELGDYDEATALLEEAGASFRAFGMESHAFLARVELVSVHVMRRDPLRALEEATRGLADARAAKRPDMEARFLQRMGNVYWDLGDDDQAAANWRLALELHRAARNAVGEAAVTLQLGDYAARRGDRAAAQAEYERALEMLRKAGSKQGEGRALTRLGSVLAERGELGRATEVQRRALEISRELGVRQSEVLALYNLGRTRAAAGDRAEASRLLEKALELTRGVGEGIALHQIVAELARIRAESGELDRALAILDEGIASAERAMGAALVPSLRASLGADAQPMYEARTEILMRRHLAAPKAGWDAKGLASAEAARGRALLALVAESEIDLREGADPEVWARYRALQERLARAGEPREVAEVASTLRVAEADLRKKSPAFAALTQPEPIGVDAIRRRVLDADTVLLEYALGERRSWMWALTRDALVSAELPPREAIEDLARRVHLGMSSHDGADASAEAELARILLGPIAAELAGPWRGRRLAIVPTGALDALPFAALPSSVGRRLVDDHEIVRLPSASFVDAVRRSKRPRATGATVALVGDPVFTEKDPRVRAPSTTPKSGAASRDPVALTALAAGGPQGFARLPFSRQEVRAVAELLPAGRAFVATDFRASRDLLLDGSLSRHRIVHLASHGLLNPAHPELSGIVLSLVDERGEPKDGFLRLQDVYNLRLDADLVVLSGCRTALGREVAGEGFIGLTRGFLHAGARRVIASSWNVDDDATATLMAAFYRAHLIDGLAPPAALRTAQRAVATLPGRRAPYFWAAFSLVGDWR